MTEIKSQIQNLLPFKKETTRRIQKRWVLALSNPYKDSSHYQNSIIELTYHEILKVTKGLYSQLQSDSKRTVFEKNCKNDNRDGILSMHTFLTSSCYLHLECSFDFKYRIQYDFFNCPFENELMMLIQLREDYSPGSCKHWQTKPNCEEFFNRVIQVQDKEHIYLLIENSSNVCKLPQTKTGGKRQ